MKTELLVASLLLSAMAMASGKEDTKNEYLRKVLRNLEKIESATYENTTEGWQPGDTVATYIRTYFVNEYDNPADSTIGACYVDFESHDTTRLQYGYNGQVRATADHERKNVTLNNFSNNKFPFRPLSAPFFNKTKNIIRYALTTNDSIETTLKDGGDHYFFRLVINEDTQVEFFGKAYHTPKEPLIWDPTSIYELWISKSDDLPYKLRREMSHDTSISTCSKVTLNTLSLNDFDIYTYFPPNYELIKQWEKANTTPNSRQIMEGKYAPDWTLSDMNEKPVSLGDIKSKILLINFTGIGCGPCGMSIPFLKSLKERFNTTEFDIVAIESWSGQARAIKVYSEKQKLNYRMLNATNEVLEKYKTEGASPYFFLLDEHRVIRKVFYGYNQSRSDKEILLAIQELLKF